MKSMKLRIVSVISAVIFCAVILGSLAFIAAEADHDCQGEGCAVCEMIKHCQQVIESLGTAAAACAVRAAFIMTAVAVLVICQTVNNTYTLISLKVELLD